MDFFGFCKVAEELIVSRLSQLDSVNSRIHTSSKRKRVKHLRRHTLARASCLYFRRNR
jgi:hypothetical protein